MTELTTQKLHELLHYDACTGVFTWKVGRMRVAAGDIAGTKSTYGYLQIKVDGHLYRAHRLAWFYQTGNWPVADIDHVNGVRTDNRFSNLREASRSDNLKNTRRRSDNRSGFKGVSWHRQAQRWVAQIRIRGENVYLGLFDTPEDAHSAYSAAVSEHFGEFGRLA